MTYFPDGATMAQVYGPAMTITDQTVADVYFDAIMAHLEKQGISITKAIRVARENLGYMAGYYDDETRARVEKLFRCAHPYFGAIASVGPPTAEQAFEMGKRMGEAWKKDSEGKP